ncbi:hypothetical protein F511_06455 [Dorcoceras hygrometricum]|uniref:Dystroglycan-like n=1 Tax=Dorcoceras hygrometricum TaxID=472368 RepID=A0A2Z7D9W7_9LAMI|nr:hypothetical protein F511_06455 [Dorcoceras hygrometricum]
MASSLISSSHHIYFDSVFGIDNSGLVQMFESLIATGLKKFLGCPAVFYEASLIEFFENSSVRDGMVVSTINGKAVQIFEEVFAAMFELPTEGLTDFSEVPKDLVFDARSLFSISKEQVSISCLKKEMKIEYRLLSDILAKTIYVKQVGGPVDDSIDKGTVVGNVANAIIEQVLDQLDSVATTDGEDQPAETAEERQWFDLPYEDLMARLDAERPVVTASDTDEEIEQVDVFTEINTAGRIGGDESIDADEAMSLEDIILSIPADVPLPSAGVEITKITMGKEIKIPGVDERTWHLASFPQNKVDDKGKEPLKQKDPIKGRPHLEHYSLICADIDLLVKLRAQVIDGVDKFFNSFSLKKLATINVEDMTKKEEKVLYWGEAESTRAALQWKGHAFRSSFVCFGRVEGAGNSTRSFMDKDVLLKIFEGHTRDRGAVIARNNTSTPSKSWIRTMIRVEGVWAVEPCADQWVKIPRPVVLNEVPRQCSYVDTLPTVSEFFKIMTKIWADVCLEVVEFCVSGKLLPVGSINLCRSLPVAQPVFSVAPRQPTVLALRISQFCTVFLDYSLFSRLPTVDITSFVASIASERTFLRSVQIISSSAVSPHIPSVASKYFVAQRIPWVLDQHSFSSCISDASMHFDDHDTATTAFSRPVAATPDVTEALAQLQASIDQIRARDGDAKLKDILLMHLHGIEQRLTAHLDDQDRVLGALRKDSHSQKQLLSLDIKSSQKQLSTQVAAAAMDTVDVRRVVKELEAKVIYLDEQVAATRNDLLEFSAQAQQTLNVITDQLSELVAYINRGDCGRLSPIRSTTRSETPSSGCTRSPDEISTNGFSTSSWPETNFPAKTAAAACEREGGL